ncbi:BlaR1 family beta-lactam sensor/signal transducer [Virgibacillus halophilus]
MDTFVLRLLLSAITVSFFILLISLIKKFFAKHLSQQMHYKIWLFIAAPPLISFFPWSSFRLQELLHYFKSLLFGGSTHTDQSATANQKNPSDFVQAHETSAWHDFALSVNKTAPDLFFKMAVAVWLVGMVFLIVLAIYASCRIHKLKKSATEMQDRQIDELLKSCTLAVGLKKKVRLRETPLLASPITLGIFKPYILLPAKTDKSFSQNELKYVLLHELCHQKNKDLLVNYIMWLLQTIYWFNPLVWHSLKKIHSDRELACDASVLELLDENGYTEYGQTIIHFAMKKQVRTYGQFSTGISGTKQQIKQRILYIAKYSGKAGFSKWKSKAICTALALLVLCLTPLTAAIASPNDVYHFKGENVVDEDMASYFSGSDGSFVLYDSAKNQYHVYNRPMSEYRVSPDSTYKIYSGLIALEENVISPAKSERNWNGINYPFKAWNKNHHLASAMHDSVNWYFQNLDQETGTAKLQDHFHRIQYGNEDLSGGLDTYWMESSLKISPIEQVQLLHAFEENKLGFDQRNTDAIKDAIFINEHEQRKLYGKTGTGTVNGKDVNGWFIGFVKTADNTYYFALNLQSKKEEVNGSKAKQIASRILQDKHIY